MMCDGDGPRSSVSIWLHELQGFSVFVTDTGAGGVQYRSTRGSDRSTRSKERTITYKAREHPDMPKYDQAQVLTGSSSACLKVSKGQRLVVEFIY